MTYVAAPDRYDQIGYRRCGRSGLKLPEISLGLWHNFGWDRPLDLQRAIVLRALDLGSRLSTSRIGTRNRVAYRLAGVLNAVAWWDAAAPQRGRRAADAERPISGTAEQTSREDVLVPDVKELLDELAVREFVYPTRRS